MNANGIHEQTIGFALQNMKASKQMRRLVHNWQELVPADSMWEPGMPGQPDCKECKGLGYIRIGGLAITHPYFGKLFLCSCVKPETIARAKAANAKAQDKKAALRQNPEDRIESHDPPEVNPDPIEVPDWMGRKDIE